MRRRWANSGRRKSHPAPPLQKCSSNPCASWPCVSARCQSQFHWVRRGIRRPDLVANRLWSSRPPRRDRRFRILSPTAEALLRNFRPNRLPDGHRRGLEDRYCRPLPDCSPDSSAQCRRAARDIWTRFLLLSDIDRPLCRSAADIPLRCWHHAHFSFYLPEGFAPADFLAPRSAVHSMGYRCLTEPSPLATLRGARLFRRELRRARGAVRSFLRGRVASRSASPQRLPVIGAPVRAIRGPIRSAVQLHSATRRLILSGPREKPVPPALLRLARSRRCSLPQRISATIAVTNRTRLTCSCSYRPPAPCRKLLCIYSAPASRFDSHSKPPFLLFTFQSDQQKLCRLSRMAGGQSIFR